MNVVGVNGAIGTAEEEEQLNYLIASDINQDNELRLRQEAILELEYSQLFCKQHSSNITFITCVLCKNQWRQDHP